MDLLNDIELRLECIRLVKEFGTENQKRNPLPIADEYYKWITRGKKTRKSLTAVSYTHSEPTRPY